MLIWKTGTICCRGRGGERREWEGSGSGRGAGGAELVFNIILHATPLSLNRLSPSVPATNVL
jgi:hypothetical protein